MTLRGDSAVDGSKGGGSVAEGVVGTVVSARCAFVACDDGKN